MPTAVPAVERTILILDFLARTREPNATLSRISESLNISKATCLSILVRLSEAGIVHRDDDRKTYRLGPELVRLGWETIGQVPGITHARREMHALARDLEVGCFACALVGNEIVVLDRAGEDNPNFAIPPSQRTRAPLRAPNGAIYMAWSPPSEIARWLEGADVRPSEADRDLYLRALTAIRARGYSIGGRLELTVQLESLLEMLGDGDRVNRLSAHLQMADLLRLQNLQNSVKQSQVHPISHLIAPAFDQNARVVLTLTMVGGLSQLTDANVDQFVAPLLAALDRITSAIGGRAPTPTWPVANERDLML